MKVDRLEAHDRLLYIQKNQSDEIARCVEAVIKRRPFGNHQFYIFAHKREIGMDERFALLMNGSYKSLGEVPTHRVIWQPRLTKPKAETNSMLFKAYPGKDEVKVIWIIPEKELWEQYKKGNVTECPDIIESIHKYENDRAALEARDTDDLEDYEIDAIYLEMSQQANSDKKKSKIILS